MGLGVADKPDSQDICFVPSGRYTTIVQKLRPGVAEPGEIIHLDGRVLGRHDGIINFTIGQRRGLGIGASEPDSEPVFVVKLDPARRQVIVGPKEALETHRLTLRDINWLGDVPLKELPEEGLPVLAKVRSTRPSVAARLRPAHEGAEIDLLQGEDGVAPGQACVFYEAGSGERVLGGGWIARAESRWQYVDAGLAVRAGAAE